jgi:hypothetical protein
VIEREPHIGAFARDRAVIGSIWMKPVIGADAAVELFVERAVDAQRRVDTHGAHRGAAVALARHHRDRIVVSSPERS